MKILNKGHRRDEATEQRNKGDEDTEQHVRKQQKIRHRVE